MSDRDELRGTLANTICNAAKPTDPQSPHPTPTESERVMNIPTEAIEAAARAMDTRALPRDNAAAALTAAAPAIQAAALRDAADEAFKDKKIQGLQRVLIGNWLCARAATIEGETK